MSQRFCEATGKVANATRKDASRAMRDFQKRKGGAELSVYHCPHCGGWHVGRNGPALLSARFRRRVVSANQLAQGSHHA